jgi:DNA-binding response OmpR family regulator
VSAKAVRILIIDDHQPHAEGLAELLAINGFETMYAVTGESGLGLAASFCLDAVLCDLKLPDMNGYEICSHIRANSAMNGTAVIFHTASEPSPGDVHDGDAFLTYPIAVEQLAVVIRGCVARRRATTQLARE